MSHETDSFIDEVTEEVRRDRLFALFRRFGWVALAVILAIVGGTAWREYSRAKADAQAQAWGDAVLAAQEAGDPVAALSALEPGDEADRAALGEILAAGAAVEAGDTAAAAARLDAAVAAAQDPVLRDLARLKAVLAGGADMDPAARDAALSELSKPGAPFRLLALEQKAVALADAGRSDDALTLIRQTLAEEGVSQALRSRLSGMMIALGVDPAANPDMPGGAAPADGAKPGDDPAAAPAAATE